MLDRLTATSFTPAVGESFTLDADEAGTLELELLEARLHDPEAPAHGPEGARAPFTLVFRGPPDPVLAQRIYAVEHASVGRLEIFLVPVARNETGTTYEAVFT